MKHLTVPLVLLTLTFGACDDTPAAGPVDASDTLADTTSDGDGDSTEPDADATGPDAADAEPEIVAPPDREPGARTPRTAACDATDPNLCLLPWPSNVFTVADPATDSGLRLEVDGSTLPAEDPIDSLRRADGFSRITPIVTGFERAMDQATLVGDETLKLIVAEGEDAGATESVHCTAHEDERDPGATAFVCYPRRPLAPATEYLVVVTGVARYADGTPVAADRTAQLSAGVVAPETTDEAALVAYHAPGRAALAAAGVAPESVIRMWDFTTRSEDDPRHDLWAIREANLQALDGGGVGIAIDEIKPVESETVAIIVRGRLTGLPSFLEPGGALARDAEGAPMVVGTRDAPFRATIPAGDGDYPVVMFCHGTGGDVKDSSFDDLIGGHGAAKVGIEIDGWTGADLGDTAATLLTPISGTDRVASMVLESIAGSSAIMESLGGQLGDLLAADTIDGVTNPAAGRHPDMTTPTWAGGSLGGVIGLTFGNLEPTIAGGILNVPGTGFTHWLPASALYDILAFGLEEIYDGPLGLNLVFAMTQTMFDPMDGASWVGARPTTPVFLVQISIGDPVLPNVGNNLVATSIDAVHLGVAIEPIPGLETAADEVVGRSAVTQFRVPSDNPQVIHGFTAKDIPVGHAAQQQFIQFVDTLWAGAPVIQVPQGCYDNSPTGSCDFTLK